MGWLTALCKSLTALSASHNVTINDVLPKWIDTERQVQRAQGVSSLPGISCDEPRVEQVESNAAKRLGLPSEFGDACAFHCSAQAGYISGYNVQRVGGSCLRLI